MDLAKGLTVGLGVLVALSAGCSSCGDQPNNDNNGTNNTTNNGTNNTTNNGTTIVECTTEEPLDLERVESDTVVQRGESGVCYSSGNIRVVSGTLTIEPGVVIKFDENALIDVESEGRLRIEGTEALPVVLTGDRETPGWWKGIAYDRSNSIDNILDWVVIQYAGRDSDGAVTFASCCADIGSLAVSNTIIEHSSSFGFHANFGAIPSKFENNTLRDNASGPAYFHVTNLRTIGPGNTFVGNGVDAVFTEGNITDGEEHNWIGIDVPYRAIDDLIVTEGIVNVGPGTTIEFDESHKMQARKEGAIGFHGTESEPVLLTGTEKTRGFWAGVHFEQSYAEASALEWTTVEYAGNGTNGAVLATSCCGDSMQVRFANSTVRESASFGIYTDGPMVELPQFEGMTLTANTLGAMSTTAQSVHFLSAGDYTGNDVDAIQIRGGEVSVNAVTWVDPGVPYAVSDDILVNDGAVLTIEAGTEFVFDSDLRFWVRSESGINAVGTAADPIVFRGAEDQPGFWRSLTIEQTALAQNELAYVEVANGGSGDSTANLVLSTCCANPLEISLSNLTIRSGTKAGIDLAVASNPVTLNGCDGITISDTASEVVYNEAAITLAEFQALCQ